MNLYPVSFAHVSTGERIAYRKSGSAEKVIILIHGNMSSSVHMHAIMEVLAKDFTVYAPDLRGLGESTYNAPFDSLHELALDVAAFADEVGIQSFQVLGWSTGGGVALELAAELPGRVENVILLGSVPVTGYPIFKKDATGNPILTEPYKDKAELAADPVQVLPLLNAYATGDRAFVRGLFDMAIYNVKQPSPDEYELLLDATMKQKSLVDIDYALLTFNMTDKDTPHSRGTGRLGKIQCPIIMLQGAKDAIVPLEWTKQSLQDMAGKATLHVFDNSGHSIITDEPEAFIAQLRKAVGLQ
ncbi:MAG: alpha/beta hydrolase [Defluviitaleaceae bacterium]|nr:alpha/beta hydrolase [Defluviitaleaceae bacterium]MCL2238430.1 alpha/beta hydrolase [Defluviitaleaceae bacterium]